LTPVVGLNHNVFEVDVHIGRDGAHVVDLGRDYLGGEGTVDLLHHYFKLVDLHSIVEVGVVHCQSHIVNHSILFEQWIHRQCDIVVVDVHVHGEVRVDLSFFIHQHGIGEVDIPITLLGSIELPHINGASQSNVTVHKVGSRDWSNYLDVVFQST
jgi:hypothetical protein